MSIEELSEIYLIRVLKRTLIYIHIYNMGMLKKFITSDFHVGFIMKAEKAYELPPAGWRPRKADVMKSKPEDSRTRSTNV